ncbi:MAG: CYTH domain-containing protein [Firmicutes bacterium]|nr:CYTH domain-containing protein [Bacillota bacterium]
METELKYSIPDRETADAVWDGAFMSPYADNSTAEKVVMKAVYFDTEDRVLSKNNVAVRVRAEGDISFATLKWGGKSENGLHERGEINVPVQGEEIFIQPPVDMFRESEDGRRLMELVGDRSFVNLLETRFLRRRMKLRYGESTMEMALDTGSIITDAGAAPILELELELYLGEVEDLLALGSLIKEKYGLEPENSSKLARGLAMLALEE